MNGDENEKLNEQLTLFAGAIVNVDGESFAEVIVEDKTVSAASLAETGDTTGGIKEKRAKSNVPKKEKSKMAQVVSENDNASQIADSQSSGPDNDLKTIDFEASLTQLESVVRDLDGEVKLEAALKLFEEGIKLSVDCEKFIKSAEQKIEILKKQADGSVNAESFERESKKILAGD
jgi:exodeoxyribonuclease VII small subunit